MPRWESATDEELQPFNDCIINYLRQGNNKNIVMPRSDSIKLLKEFDDIEDRLIRDGVKPEEKRLTKKQLNCRKKRLTHKHRKHIFDIIWII